VEVHDITGIGTTTPQPHARNPPPSPSGGHQQTEQQGHTRPTPAWLGPDRFIKPLFPARTCWSRRRPYPSGVISATSKKCHKHNVLARPSPSGARVAQIWARRPLVATSAAWYSATRCHCTTAIWPPFRSRSTATKEWKAAADGIAQASSADLCRQL
jgi:hypothetical protein